MTILLLPNNLETKNPSSRVQPLQRTKKTTTSRNCWKMQYLTSSHDLRILRKLLLSILRFLTSSFGHENKSSWHFLVETMFQCIVDHYKEQLSGDECNKIRQEWVALRSYVAHFCGRPLLQVYGELLRDRPARFQNILVLVDLISYTKSTAAQQNVSVNTHP